MASVGDRLAWSERRRAGRRTAAGRRELQHLLEPRGPATPWRGRGTRRRGRSSDGSSLSRSRSNVDDAWCRARLCGAVTAASASGAAERGLAAKSREDHQASQKSYQSTNRSAARRARLLLEHEEDAVGGAESRGRRGSGASGGRHRGLRDPGGGQPGPLGAQLGVGDDLEGLRGAAGRSPAPGRACPPGRAGRRPCRVGHDPALRGDPRARAGSRRARRGGAGRSSPARWPGRPRPRSARCRRRRPRRRTPTARASRAPAGSPSMSHATPSGAPSTVVLLDGGDRSPTKPWNSPTRRRRCVSPGGGGTSPRPGAPQPQGRVGAQLIRPLHDDVEPAAVGPGGVVVEHGDLVGRDLDDRRAPSRPARSSRRASRRLDGVHARQRRDRGEHRREVDRRAELQARGVESPGEASRARAQQLEDRGRGAASGSEPGRRADLERDQQADRRARDAPRPRCRASAGRRGCADPVERLARDVVRSAVEVDDGRRSAATNPSTRGARSRAARRAPRRPRRAWSAGSTARRGSRGERLGRVAARDGERRPVGAAGRRRRVAHARRLDLPAGAARRARVALEQRQRVRRHVADGAAADLVARGDRAPQRRGEPDRAGAEAQHRGLVLLDVDDDGEVGAEARRRAACRTHVGADGRGRTAASTVTSRPMRAARSSSQREARARRRRPQPAPPASSASSPLRRAVGRAARASAGGPSTSRPWCAGTRLPRATVTSSAPSAVSMPTAIGRARGRPRATRRRGRASSPAPSSGSANGSTAISWTTCARRLGSGSRKRGRRASRPARPAGACAQLAWASRSPGSTTSKASRSPGASHAAPSGSAGFGRTSTHSVAPAGRQHASSPQS